MRERESLRLDQLVLVWLTIGFGLWGGIEVLTGLGVIESMVVAGFAELPIGGILVWVYRQGPDN